MISVAAGTLDHHRGDFSSNGLGLRQLAGRPQIGGGGHTTWTGDRIGVYHPDVTAPGVDISSTCDTVGTVIGPCPPPDYGNATADGTSMASPHIAGAAAVLLQANPSLTPDQVRSALQATATPVKAADGTRAARSGRSATATSTSTPPSRWSARKQLGEGPAEGPDAGRRPGPGRRRVRRRAGPTCGPYDAPRATVAGTDSHTYAVDRPDRDDAPQGHPVASVPGRRRDQRHELHGHRPRRRGPGPRHDDRDRLTAGAGTASVVHRPRRRRARRSPTAPSRSRSAATTPPRTRTPSTATPSSAGWSPSRSPSCRPATSPRLLPPRCRPRFLRAGATSCPTPLSI